MPDLPPPPEEPRDLPPWNGDDPAEEDADAALVPAPAASPAPAARRAPAAVTRAEPAPQPLSDIQAERALLGALLLNPEMYYEVADRVSAQDFTFLAHRHIWEAMSALISQSHSVDVAVLAAELRRKEVLDEVGGVAYLSELLTEVDRSLSAPHYARLVADYSLRRQLQAAAQEIVRLAHRTDMDGDEVLHEAERLLFRIGSERYRRDVQDIGRVLTELREHLERLKEREGLAGIPTGFKHLDNLLKGLQPSDLIIVAGRPGMGKTAFLVTLALNAARKGKRVAIFSLEMSNEQVAQRMLSQETGLGADLFRSPQRFTSQQWEQLQEAMDRLAALAIFLDDTPALTPQQLRVKCLRLSQQHGLDLVIVDYLQLMSGGRRTENRVQEVSYISRSLKHLARDLNIPVLAAAQLSRAVEQRADKRPMLSDLRESGALEQDADVVMFLFREKYYEQQQDGDGDGAAPRRLSREPEPVELHIAKHRNGPTGLVELTFEPWKAAFREARVDPRGNTTVPIDLNRPDRLVTFAPPPEDQGLVDDDFPAV